MTPSQKTKVLFFQHNSKNGGAPRSLFQIVKEYEKEFGPQSVLFPRPGPVISTYDVLSSEVRTGFYLLPFHGSEVSGMNWKIALRNILGLFEIPFAWLRYLRGYDVIYLNSSALCFYGLFIKAVSPKTRVICHIREPLMNNGWGRIIRQVLRRGADHFIAISGNELSNLGLPQASGEVVYNYVHSTEYMPEKGSSLHRRDPKVGSEAFVVGYFARLDNKNGLGDFIALARRFERDPGVAFCIYGHTGEEKSEEAAQLKEAGKNVHVYPMVSDVPANLGDLDLLLVPFKKPHFSRSVVEAAMLRVPSIIYDIPSVNETVKDGETGYVVPLNDQEAMGDRVEQLRADPETYARLAEAAHDFAMESFSEKNYLKIREAINTK